MYALDVIIDMKNNFCSYDSSDAVSICSSDELSNQILHCGTECSVPHSACEVEPHP